MRDERLFPMFAGLDTLTGVGPKMKPLLERLVDGETIWDLLLHLPERWVDRRVRASFDQVVFGEVATVQGEVHAYQAPYSDKAPHRIQLFDGTGFLTLAFFRADGRWLQGQFPLGSTRIVSGRVEDFKGERQMTHPDYIVDPAKGDQPPEVEPIYGLTAGLTNKRVHSLAVQALNSVPDGLPEWSDVHLVAQKGWVGFKDALIGLHNPPVYDETAFDLARERLAYDEALARESAFALARASRKRRNAPPIPQAQVAQSRLARSLPYRQTGAQVRAVAEISEDMARQSPMRRMLQGDVGSGKTLVGAMAAVQAAAGGFQSAFMVPTEVLARQQFETLDRLLSPQGYVVASLTGRDKGAAREGTLLGLADGSIHVVAGTHALFQESVSFRNLGLIIVDEQHRFGVQDRMRLVSKATSPHMLVMSATPIPRTLAQAVHGDLDVTILDEKPQGRKPIETRALPDTRIDEVVDAVGRAVRRGEQAFWVCPKVDVDDDDSTAVGRHAALAEQLGVPVGLVHGRLKPTEKDTALEDFRSGRTKILVATTVIEVGVDVPEATIMVIERAEGFGLAQLHQLRGRVGRGDKPSFCLLLYRPPLGDMARERLETLRRTEDGFEIAEADFKLRGPGDMLGLRQAGATDYRLIDLSRHAGLLAIAKKDATAAIDADPELAGPRGQALRLVRELLTPRVPTGHSG
ncbi:MAG: ATP-dependent DNA helicase RecG [Hyphomonas sp. BRH_c22]|uniref:ATP-dependent DNA helicase RecG n=1 Tax=Hyphomonas sp. BRH_c22 TaxID=1629710 RepID=UPI0005F2739C|nr:ATP-dependent DNA helicase RecG [Hyphomonas sp. BRH_c22]KJS36383.1 MAG: ATP-dependent DNA helicase RecG [Hyphomonas sp. BRH_c22]